MSLEPGAGHLKRVGYSHTNPRRGALAASCIAASCIRQRRPAPHVSGQNGLRHKASIAARGASDRNPYQGVLQTMALHAAQHMSYREPSSGRRPTMPERQN